MLKLYNTATRKKEIFKPLNKNEARIYSCGPTVYDFAHIGNLRTYIFADILRRSLEFLGYKVKQVINITDVGHLTYDNDFGEDKIEKSAREKNKSAWEIAKFYEEQFLKDISELNILPPHIMPRATEHIAEQIEIIKILKEKGFTYIIENDGVYFNTAKFPKYGQFAGKDRLKKRFSRIGENKNKKNPWDFALWKFSPNPLFNGQKRQMEWQSPWGVGFPGWHIECSAMSKKYLGQPFDIHTGGVDHIAIHHQNEIAQSEAAFNQKLANYWLHGEFLNLGAKRMGKSEGNLMTLTDLKNQGFDPLSFRFLCLNTHYRKKMFFSLNILSASQKSLANIVNLYQKLLNLIFKNKTNRQNAKVKKESKKLISNIKRSIEDNLNTPKALGYFFNYVKFINEILKGNMTKKDLAIIKNTFKEADKIFAILPPQNKLIVESSIIEKLKQREILRKEKKFDQTDNIRKDIMKEGYIIEDMPNLISVYKKWPN